MWPTKNRRSDLTLTVPALDGGVDYEKSPQLIGNDELSDALNVVYREGALKARKGLKEMPDYTVAGLDFVPLTEHRVSPYRNGSFAKVWFRDLYPNLGAIVFGYVWYMNTAGTITTGSFSDNVGVGYKGGFVYPWKNYNVFVGCQSDDTMNVVGLGDTAPSETAPLLLMNAKGTTTPTRVLTGTTLEGRNLLTGHYRAQFTSDGTAKYFWAPMQDGDLWTGSVVTVTNSDGSVSTFNLTSVQTISPGISYLYNSSAVDGLFALFNPIEGVLLFSTSISPSNVTALPSAGVSGNIELLASKAIDHTPITKCNVAKWFGGSANGNAGGTRLFVSGNPDYPGRVWWSDVGDPGYFPENNWADVGSGNENITAFGQQGSILVAFCPSSTHAISYAYSGVTTEQVVTVNIIDATTQGQSLYIFPISDIIGCDLPDTVATVGNRLMWATKANKVFALSGTNQYDQRNITEISQKISRELDLDDTASAAGDSGSYLLYCNFKAWYFNGAWWPYEFTGPDISMSFAWDHAMRNETDYFLFGWNKEGVGEYTAMAFALSDEGGDDTWWYDTASASWKIRKQPFECSFSTKLFDFGYPSRIKRVFGVYLFCGSKEESKVTPLWLTDHVGYCDGSYFVLPPDSADVSLLRCKVLYPNGRALSFGMSMTSDKPITYGSLEIRACVEGRTR